MASKNNKCNYATRTSSAPFDRFTWKNTCKAKHANLKKHGVRKPPDLLRTSGSIELEKPPIPDLLHASGITKALICSTPQGALNWKGSDSLHASEIISYFRASRQQGLRHVSNTKLHANFLSFKRLSVNFTSLAPSTPVVGQTCWKMLASFET